VASWILDSSTAARPAVPWQTTRRGSSRSRWRLRSMSKTESASRRRTLAPSSSGVRMIALRVPQSRSRGSARTKVLTDDCRAEARQCRIHIPPGPRLGVPASVYAGRAEGLRDGCSLRPDVLLSRRKASIGVIALTAPQILLFRNFCATRGPEQRRSYIVETVKSRVRATQSRADLNPANSRSGRRSSRPHLKKIDS